jgi:biopolymer transport protein ExbD
MDPFRFRVLIAPAMASLFLVLSLCAFVVQKPESVGIRIPMIRIHHDPHEPYDCGGRPVFVRLTRDGKSWINETEVTSNRLVPVVSALMENRAERVVYVVVDSDLSYGQFVTFLDRIKGATDDLHVVVVSGVILKAFKENHDLCDFIYPGNDF